MHFHENSAGWSNRCLKHDVLRSPEVWQEYGNQRFSEDENTSLKPRLNKASKLKTKPSQMVRHQMQKFLPIKEWTYSPAAQGEKVWNEAEQPSEAQPFSRDVHSMHVMVCNRTPYSGSDVLEHNPISSYSLLLIPSFPLSLICLPRCFHFYLYISYTHIIHTHIILGLHKT